MKRYFAASSHVLDPEPSELDSTLPYAEKPVGILDTKVRSTRRKDITMVKVYGQIISVRRLHGRPKPPRVGSTQTSFSLVKIWGRNFIKGAEGDRNFARING